MSAPENEPSDRQLWRERTALDIERMRLQMRTRTRKDIVWISLTMIAAMAIGFAVTALIMLNH